MSCVLFFIFFFFFFKQKTAYEMRISDWSSDVCSSDLFATATDLCAIRAVTLQRAKPGRQGTIVRHRLTLTSTGASTTLIGIIFTQQAQLQHQRRHQRAIELFPTPPAQVARQYHLAKTCPNKTTDGDACRFNNAATFPATT